jgi:site-specific recombinase XerC
MEDLIEAYALDQQRRGLSPNTVDKRTRTLRLVTRSPHFQLERESIESYLDSRGLSAKTRATYLSHIGCFFEWAVDAGHLEVDPTAKIKAPKLPRRLPWPVTDAELDLMVAKATPRLLAMTLLGSLAGLRCLEIASLEGRGVTDTIRVIGKGNKERTVPLHPELGEALSAFGLPDLGPVFYRPRGGRMTPDAVSHELGSFIHSLGISGGAHRLRHYFGTAMYRATLDLRLVQELMGDEDPSTTAVYAAADMTKAAVHVAGLRRAA